MRMAAVENNAEGCIFESALIHRGKGAPIPPDRERGSKLTGFTMPSDSSSVATRVAIQSAGSAPLTDLQLYLWRPKRVQDSTVGQTRAVEPPSYGRVSVQLGMYIECRLARVWACVSSQL